MFAALDHFRWEIVESAAEGGAPITWRVHAPAKVADLELAVDAEKQILRLDVPVDDVFRMEVGEGVCHLVDIDGTTALREGAKLCELLVELALAGELEHEENTLLVVEVAVEAQDIGVSEVLLDLDFATNLLLHAGLYDLRLVEALEGEDVIGLDFGANHVDPAEFTLA